MTTQFGKDNGIIKRQLILKLLFLRVRNYGRKEHADCPNNNRKRAIKMHNSRIKELSPKALESISLTLISEVKKTSLNNHCELYIAIKLILREYSRFQNVADPFLLTYLNLPDEYTDLRLPNSFDFNSAGYLVDYIFQNRLALDSIGNNHANNMRKKLGAFFTPYPIAEFITKKTINSYDHVKILDPACGTGVFLSAAAQTLYSKGIAPRDICNSLYGWDKNKEALYVAKVLLSIELGLTNNEQERFFSKNNYIEKDTLIEPIEQNDLFTLKINYVDIEYDFIIANPPYDRLKPDKSSPEYKNEVTEYIKKIKSSYLYPLSSTGVLDLYKLFIERIKQISEGSNTRVGIIIPASFTNDKSAYKLRNELLVQNTISEVLFLPEKIKAFFGVSQAFAIIFMDFNRQEYYIKTKTVTSSQNLSTGKNNIISNSNILLAFVKESNIVDMQSEGYDLLEHLNTFTTIKDVKNIENKRGELDLSLFKEYMGSGEPRLLRGKHIQEYGIPSDMDLVKYDAFLDKIKSTPKYEHVHQQRIVCQQISNMDSKKRLKFTIVPKKIILGNSLNYVLTAENENYLYGLLAIMNSILIDWRFRITSSNNHINNYEIDNLPVPNNINDLCKLGNKLKRNINDISSPIFRREIEFDVLELFNCTKFVDFLIYSHPMGTTLMRESKFLKNIRDEHELHTIQP
jgi:adenine-specific DNA-methyltransferase